MGVFGELSPPEFDEDDRKNAVLRFAPTFGESDSSDGGAGAGADVGDSAEFDVM